MYAISDSPCLEWITESIFNSDSFGISYCNWIYFPIKKKSITLILSNLITVTSYVIELLTVYRLSNIYRQYIIGLNIKM